MANHIPQWIVNFTIRNKEFTIMHATTIEIPHLWLIITIN